MKDIYQQKKLVISHFTNELKIFDKAIKTLEIIFLKIT